MVSASTQIPPSPRPLHETPAGVRTDRNAIVTPDFVRPDPLMISRSDAGMPLNPGLLVCATADAARTNTRLILNIASPDNSRPQFGYGPQYPGVGPRCFERGHDAIAINRSRCGPV